MKERTIGGLARYFLSESALLAAASGIIGFALAWGSLRLLVTLGPANLPRLAEIQLDGMSVAFTAALTVVAALAFGAIPLWRGHAAHASLHDSGRGTTASRGWHRTRQLLMGGQVALALVLLVSSGLMARSFQKLRALDPGFDAKSALSFSIALQGRDYPTRETAVAAHRAILDRLSSLPGVTAVSASTCLPLTGRCFGNTVLVRGRAVRPDTVPPLSDFRAVADGYFTTMGVRVVRGRHLDRGDVDRKAPVVVANQAFVDRYFPNQDPIGEHVASNRAPDQPGEPPNLKWLEIVGVVSNTPAFGLAEVHPEPQLYMPMSIAGGPDIPMSALIGPNVGMMSYIVRSARSPRGLLPAVRQAVGVVDQGVAIANVRTLQDVLDEASAQPAFTMALIAIAATVALLLGMIGIYGVMSYIVTQRTGEIGVRLALGADPRSVARLIVRQGGLVAVAGIAVGLGAALGGSRVIESLLYDVSPRDPSVFAVTTCLLLGVALVACWLPARRAARLSPLEALRTE